MARYFDHTGKEVSRDDFLLTQLTFLSEYRANQRKDPQKQLEDYL